MLPSLPDPSDDDDYAIYPAGDDRLYYADDDDDDDDDDDSDDDEDDDEDDDDDDDETAAYAGNGSGGYEYVGCFSDSGTGRILNTMVYDDDGNSVVVSCVSYKQVLRGIRSIPV